MATDYCGFVPLEGYCGVLTSDFFQADTAIPSARFVTEVTAQLEEGQYTYALISDRNNREVVKLTETAGVLVMERAQEDTTSPEVFLCGSSEIRTYMGGIGMTEIMSCLNAAAVCDIQSSTLDITQDETTPCIYNIELKAADGTDPATDCSDCLLACGLTPGTYTNVTAVVEEDGDGRLCVKFETGSPTVHSGCGTCCDCGGT